MEHLTTDQIASFLDNKLSEKEKLTIVEHLLDCQECYHEMLDIYFILNDKSTTGNLKLNHNIKETAFSFGNYDNQWKNRENILSKHKFIISFATVLLAVSIIVIFSIIPMEEKNQFREYDTGTYLKIITPVEEAVLNKENIFLEWDNLDNTFLYRVVIYNEIGKVLLDTSINRNSIDLTGKLNFEDSRKYFWDVKAIYTNGQVITSKLNAFSIK